MMLQFGPWRPDLHDAASFGVTEAVNVVPAAGSYEPQSSLEPFSGAIGQRCQGAVSVLDSGGSAYWFAGDRWDLYVINVQTNSWSIVSRQVVLPNIGAYALGEIAAAAAFGTAPIIAPQGFAATSGFGSISLSATLVTTGFAEAATFGDTPLVVTGGLAIPATFGGAVLSITPRPYSTDSDAMWSFAQYGDNVFATNYGDPIQVYSLGANGFFNDLGGDSPRARHLAVVKNFLVAANTVDSDGTIPQRVRWSGIDNPFSWTVSAVTQADFSDLFGEGGENQGIATGLSAADAVIIQERAVWRMTYSGPPLVFQFDTVEGIRGTPAPNSIVTVGGNVYYLGEDGFYAFDGAQSRPIGQGKIDRTFFNEVDPTYYTRITSVADVDRKLVLWAYPSTSAGGIPDKILVYNWATTEWSKWDVATEFLWRTLSFGATLEDLDDIESNIDLFPITFDSRQFTGGIEQLSAFDTGHQTSHFSGVVMAATITTREITVPDPRRFLVTQTWPIVECRTAADNVQIAVGKRTTTNVSTSFATAVAMNANGFCPQRSTDHYLRFRVSLSAGSTWSRAMGIEVIVGSATTWR